MLPYVSGIFCHLSVLVLFAPATHTPTCTKTTFLSTGNVKSGQVMVQRIEEVIGEKICSQSIVERMKEAAA